MQLRIRRADFSDPQLVDFLRDHLDELAPTAPAESRHALDMSGLQAPGVRLWVAHDDTLVVGTAALAPLAPRHEELKSMRTHPARRGQGLAAHVLTHVLADARARGVEWLWLETGSMAFFAPARTLYAKAGFRQCQPFGDYAEDPNSVFMALAL